MAKKLISIKFIHILLVFLVIGSSVAFAQVQENMNATESALPWWAYPILLFSVTVLIGILSVMAGVGGGVLFVPIVSVFFPFGFDFVRGAGLFVAMAMSLSAGPRLLRKGLANLRLALPIALITSVGAIVGAMVGFALPDNIVQTALGVVILGVVVLMLCTKRAEFPKVEKPGPLCSFLNIGGVYFEHWYDKDVEWSVHRMIPGLFLFFFVGVASGMFGLGGGWANVPVLNLVLGLPLKMAVATSGVLMSVSSTSAAWIYFNKGAVLPIMLVPSIAGIMVGSKIGSRLLLKSHPKAIRYIVLIILALAGIRSLLKGLGI